MITWRQFRDFLWVCWKGFKLIVTAAVIGLLFLIWNQLIFMTEHLHFIAYMLGRV